MLNIRTGQPRDIPRLVELGEDFWEHTWHKHKGQAYSGETVAHLCEFLMHRGNGNGFIVVLTDDDDVVQGFGLVAFTPFVFDINMKTATELAFYVVPEYRKGKEGIRLLKSMENISRNKGCAVITMVSMEHSNPRPVEKLYESMGYERTETSYTKELRE